MKLFAALAFLFCACLAGCGSSGDSTTASSEESAAPQATPFLSLRAGQTAILKDDGGAATTGTVCNSAASLRENVASSGASIAGCAGRRPGQRVEIVSLGETLTAITTHMKTARVRASDGRWQGFVEVANLAPILPIGTIVSLKKLGESGPQLALNSDSADAAQFDVADPSTAKIIGFTNDVENRNVKVEVIDGDDKGKVGWTTQNSVLVGDVSAWTFLDDLTVDPEPTDPQ